MSQVEISYGFPSIIALQKQSSSRIKKSSSRIKTNKTAKQNKSSKVDMSQFPSVESQAGSGAGLHDHAQSTKYDYGDDQVIQVNEW